MHSYHLALAFAALAAITTAQNTNDAAPIASHVLEFADETKIAIEYRQLSLESGKSLRRMLSRTELGAQMRQFYNTQYMPSYLNGKIETSAAITLGGHDLPAGQYGFLFRVDDQLVWHVVITGSKGKELFTVALKNTSSKRAKAKRLSVLPVATANEQPGGHLLIRYGPLSARLAFGASATEAAAKKKTDGQAPEPDAPKRKR